MFIQITWSIAVSEQLGPCDTLCEKHSRAGAGTGIQEALPEVAPRMREPRVLEGWAWAAGQSTGQVRKPRGWLCMALEVQQGTSQNWEEAKLMLPLQG